MPEQPTITISLNARPLPDAGSPITIAVTGPADQPEAVMDALLANAKAILESEKGKAIAVLNHEHAWRVRHNAEEAARRSREERDRAVLLEERRTGLPRGVDPAAVLEEKPNGILKVIERHLGPQAGEGP